MIERGFSSDVEIWNAFREGNERAYELMFREHYALLINYGLKFSSEVEEVKDCVQQLFTNLWDSRERLGDNDFIKGYLMASMRRALIRKSKKKIMALDIQAIQPKFMLSLSVDNQYVRDQSETEQAQMMSQLINTLPSRQKEALYLKFYEEQSYAEIAEVMGISTRGVYKLIYKALNNMGQQLEVCHERNKYTLSLAIT